jgi:hypothetical protein
MALAGPGAGALRHRAGGTGGATAPAFCARPCCPGAGGAAPVVVQAAARGRACRQGRHLWATEQALRCAPVDAVLAWLPQARTEQLRRLHLAAAEHHKLLFVMRSDQARQDASPAVLRLQLSSDADGGLCLELLKRRGPPLEHSLHLAARTPALRQLLAVADMAQPNPTQQTAPQAAARVQVFAPQPAPSRTLSRVAGRAP